MDIGEALGIGWPHDPRTAAIDYVKVHVLFAESARGVPRLHSQQMRSGAGRGCSGAERRSGKSRRVVSKAIKGIGHAVGGNALTGIGVGRKREAHSYIRIRGLGDGNVAGGVLHIHAH